MDVEITRLHDTKKKKKIAYLQVELACNNFVMLLDLKFSLCVKSTESEVILLHF